MHGNVTIHNFPKCRVLKQNSPSFLQKVSARLPALRATWKAVTGRADWGARAPALLAGPLPASAGPLLPPGTTPTVRPEQRPGLGPPGTGAAPRARWGVAFRSAAAGRLPVARAERAYPAPAPEACPGPSWAAAGRRRLSPRPPSAGDAALNLPGDQRRAGLTSESGDVRPPPPPPRSGSAALRQRVSRESGRTLRQTALVSAPPRRTPASAPGSVPSLATEATGSRQAGRRAAARTWAWRSPWTRPRAQCGYLAETPGPRLCTEGCPRGT